MFTIIKTVTHRIPKKGITTLASPFAGVIADRLFDSFVLQQPFIGWPRFVSAILWSGAILLLYFFGAFVYQSLKVISDLTSVSAANAAKPLLIRKKLEVSEVSIGTFQDELLAVGILAKIVLMESSKPGVEVFLNRIRLGDPYCPRCKRSMDKTYLDPRVPFGPTVTGFACRNCSTAREGDIHDLYQDAEGEVRREYDRYWDGYIEVIRDLTHGIPNDYVVE